MPFLKLGQGRFLAFLKPFSGPFSDLFNANIIFSLKVVVGRVSRLPNCGCSLRWPFYSRKHLMRIKDKRISGPVQCKLTNVKNY